MGLERIELSTSALSDRPSRTSVNSREPKVQVKWGERSRANCHEFWLACDGCAMEQKSVLRSRCFPTPDDELQRDWPLRCSSWPETQRSLKLATGGRCRPGWSARFEMIAEGLPDDLGHRDSFVLCPARQALFELGIESDGFDG